MPIKITETIVKDAVPPPTGSVSVWDSELTGFLLRVHSKGTRSFAFDYRLNGRPKRISIGKFPAWTAARARVRAKELRHLVDAGGDPAGQKRERRDAATVQDLIDRYVRDHLPKLRLQRPKENDRMLDEIADILGRDSKVCDIHYGDMEDLHRKITGGYTDKRGRERKPRPVRANRVLATASILFNMSLRPLPGENKPWRSGVDGNPCRGVQRNHEEPAGRLYSPAELAGIADALAEFPGRTAADCLTLIALTGCRPSEAKRALWAEFDSKAGFWCKPSSHTKQKREHTIPLAPPALQLIEQLRAERDPAKPMVFPGRSPDGTVDALHHCWRFVRERAGLDKSCRVYDLRHSFASLGAGGGLGLPVIGRLLGHSSAKTTERYARHLADDPLQSAVNMIAGKITGKRPRLVSGGQP